MACLYFISLYCLWCGLAAVSALPPRALKEVIVASNLTTEQLSRVAFKYKYVNNFGNIYMNKPTEPSIRVAATVRVSNAAHYKAATIISHMLRHMPSNIFKSISRSHGVGIFSRFESVAVYPEFAHLADRPECRGTCKGNCRSTCSGDGRKFSSLGGLASNIAVCLEDIVMCSANDPYGHKENILIHEFAHTIRIYLPHDLAKRADAAYTQAKRLRLWTKGNYPYAMSNFQEFWAGATESFFMTTTRLDFTGGMNMCGTNRACGDEIAARDYIKRHQPDLFSVLSEVYTGNKPHIRSGLRICM